MTRKTPSGRMLAMLLIGGIVLAIGGCGLFLANLNVGGSGHSPADTLSAAGAIIFIAGVLSVVGAIIWVIVVWIDRRFDRHKKGQ